MTSPYIATTWQKALPPGMPSRRKDTAHGVLIATKMPKRVCLNCGGEVRTVGLADGGFRLKRADYCCMTCREMHRNKPRIA